MMNKEDFAQYVDMAMQGDGLGFMRPVVEKELLHYEIFIALDEDGLLKNLVFQGGTSLRLCYGSERFSEDLDFAGGKNFSAQSMAAIKDCIIGKIGKRFALDVTVREPKDVPFDGVVRVDKWMVSIQTSPGRPDVPRQKIKLEISNVPAYSRNILPLRINYSVLEGRSQPLVAVESRDEILADKLIALPASISKMNGQKMEFTPSRIRHRDIWDIAWLSGQGAQMDTRLVRNKISDYGLVEFPRFLDRAIAAIPAIAGGDGFRTQMARFLPQAQHDRVFGKVGYEKYFESAVNGLLSRLRQELEPEVKKVQAMPLGKKKRGPEL
ncbi:nucleotidyl transferase AbiEii/AbiGii toxin family protein [Acidithiobacillus sulfuriphilus]|uniref:nucleotidyl transferase AbiEii/AbiGii toxin family protein n=1 Tax=Acidithiobacillus sulfuriphilus TaxID=1867749 RepID=UPI003F5E919E